MEAGKGRPSRRHGGVSACDPMSQRVRPSCNGAIEGGVRRRRRRCSSSARRIVSCKAGSVMGCTRRRTTGALAFGGDASDERPRRPPSSSLSLSLVVSDSGGGAGRTGGGRMAPVTLLIASGARGSSGSNSRRGAWGLRAAVRVSWNSLRSCASFPVELRTRGALRVAAAGVCVAFRNADGEGASRVRSTTGVGAGGARAGRAGAHGSVCCRRGGDGRGALGPAGASVRRARHSSRSNSICGVVRRVRRSCASGIASCCVRKSMTWVWNAGGTQTPCALSTLTVRRK